MKNLVGLFILLLLVVLSCKKEDDTTSFDSSTVYVDASERIILNTEAFYTSVQQLVGDLPNSEESFSSDEITRLKKSYVSSLLAWQKVEPYIIGDVFDEFAHLYINNWGADTASINQLLELNEIAESDYNALPSRAKGLPSIAYLLYQVYPSSTNKITVIKLLKLAINDLSVHAETIRDSWNSYQTAFVDQMATGRNSSLNLLLNAMYLQVELLKNRRLGNPSGLFSDIEDYLKVFEAPYSKSSVACMLANFAEFKAMYQLSLSHLIVNNGGTLIATEIETSINKIDVSYSKLQTPIVTNFQDDMVEINELFEELKTLEKLLKYDVKELLSATIYLGSDDGD